MIAHLMRDMCKLLWWGRALAHSGYGRLSLRLAVVVVIIGIGIAAGGGDLAAIDWSLLAAYSSHDNQR